MKYYLADYDKDIKPLSKAKKKPKMKGKKFALNRAKAPQKTIINNILARHGRRDKLAIVLDGENAHTTKALIKSGWKKNNIFIPNFSEDYKKILRKGYQATNVSLGDYLYKTRQDSIGLLYADYMCSLEGNANCKPLEDIEYLFDGHLLADGACLGITITLRSKTCDKNFVNNAVQKLISEINTLGFENDYVTTLLPVGGVYKNGGPMWTGIFQVFKI